MALSSRSLITQMFVYFSLLVLTPLLIVIFMSYSSFTRSMEQSTKQSVEYATNHAVEAMNDYYADFDRLTVSIVKDDGLWRLLEARGAIGSDLQLEKLQNAESILKILSTYKYTRNDVIDIGLYTESGELFHSSLDRDKLLQSPWFRDFSGRTLLRGTYLTEAGTLVHLSRINDPNRFTEFYGYLIYEVDRNIFDDIFREQEGQYHTSVYVFNESGQLIYERGGGIDPQRLLLNRSTGTHSVTENNNRFLVVSKYSRATDWFVSQAVPYEYIVKGANSLRGTSILLVLVSYFFALAVTIVLSRRVARPLRKMMVAMRQLGSGSTDIRIEEQGPAEVREISQRFNTMNVQIGSLIAGIVEEQKKVREADLAALQAQIHPHFLYNTLNLIVSLARKNNVQDIQTLTGSLIELLQNSARSKRMEATAAGELNMLEHYILLHQFRSEGKVRLFIEADPELLGMYMPQFLLQPLVENAVFHGIYPKDGEGSIRIVVRRNGDMCELKVIDDGVGMDLQRSVRPRSGLGLANVAQRLRHYFPDGRSDLTVFSKPGVGTAVMLTFPVIRIKSEVSPG